MKEKQSLVAAVRNALQGIAHALRHERNFGLQILGAAVAVATVAIVRPGKLWAAVILVAIAVVLTAELLNTAIERLCDHLNPEQHPEIRIVKDCAAAAVFVASLGAIGVAICFALRFFFRDCA